MSSEFIKQLWKSSEYYYLERTIYILLTSLCLEVIFF